MYKILALVGCALAMSACAAGPSSPICLAGATLAGGKCRVQQAPRHHVPFRPGTVTTITQAYHGQWTHKGDYSFSVDLLCEEGTPVTASRGGRVFEVYEESDTSCDDMTCLDKANYVILDHGDGTYSQYFHLRHLGALVEEDDHVCAGEIIGLCGKTGYAIDSHVHFAVTDLTARRTLPFQFEEAATEQRFGFPIPDAALESQNERELGCDDAGYSFIDEGGFAHQGVVLDDPLTTVVSERATRLVSGTYYGDSKWVAIHRKADRPGAVWLEECVSVDDRGRFRFDLDWPRDQFVPGYYWVMITGANSRCEGPGWAWSYKVRVR